ncbi:RagB/SusD family nutrient uptake outer membrane protein [Sphingobacterium puteale]|uniref:RagB/SusD family nutrient uptake outer membrane protein n=1 Tax=Sphingobacterium puteale TaxID=2420510 RepID=A0A420VXZ9_9SPHI|nr:RagB/SusD family nutrient uptake outer membrane protein [Sphingobacterium puteale]RKO71283.1 RagB/SusD family nutrient uptake outer membrane protein [Sphingobacterium puteale]
MKRTFIYTFLLGASLSLLSCGKDFLNITQIDKLTGNNYWTSKGDVEQYMGGIYSTFREATMTNIFFPASGDLRCAPTNRTSATSGAGRDYISLLRQNNLNSILTRSDENQDDNFSYFRFPRITQWNNFYKMVQNANIICYQIDNKDMPFLSEEQKKAYKAEAIFLRSLAYFFMVRLYGDVPYYTDVNTDPLPRTNMVTVLRNVSAELDASYKDLPWTYDDPSIVAVKAMRGSALALNMHVNMWIAGFANEDKAPYYEKVASMGRELMEENGGAYTLLSLTRTKDIFKGRTKEGLFEIVQNFNYGESFHLSASYSDYVLHAPNKVTTKSYIYYDPKFMEKMYPPAEQDLRKTYWFDDDIYATNGDFQCLKFANVFMEEGEDNNPDDNQMIFRYSDPILLRAEALAELNRDEEARAVVNVIRKRAEAADIMESGDDLKDAIWWERVRELLGEGNFYYDLVRTKKVINSEYTPAPMSVGAFNGGGWTWPIDKSALVNNPYMRLNNYWN